VAALQAAGFEVRAVDEEAATRLRAGCVIVGGVVADADQHLEGVVEALTLRGLVFVSTKSRGSAGSERRPPARCST